MPYRFLALMLAVVLVITLATPAKAEAFDVMTGLAIAGAAIIVLVLVVYLIVANVEGPKMGKAPDLDGPRVVGVVQRHRAVERGEALAQSRVGIAGGDQAAEAAAGQGGHVAPDVIVAEAEDAHPQRRHNAGHRTAL